MMELWDAYDKELKKLSNVSLIRGEPIPRGMYHIVCETLVRHTDGTYLVMQRDYRKPFGGMWEATAGGSALQGESPSECAKRELFEETGIASDKLQPVGIETNELRQTYYFEYMCTVTRDKNCVVLQSGETIAYKWIDESCLFAMTKEELATHRMLKYINSNNE